MKILLLASILAASVLPTPVAAVKTLLQCTIEFLIFSCHHAAVGICTNDLTWAAEVNVRFSARLDVALAMLIWKGTANQGKAITAETLALKARDPNYRRAAFTQADNVAAPGQKTFVVDCDERPIRDSIGVCLTSLLNRAATNDPAPKSLADFRTHLGTFNTPTHPGPVPPTCT